MTDLNKQDSNVETANPKKRSWVRGLLIATGVVVTLGTVSAAVGSYHWHSMDKEERIEMIRGKAADRLERHLDLSDNQRSAFEELTSVLGERAKVYMGAKEGWSGQIAGFIQGSQFDRAGAKTFLTERLNELETMAPTTIDKFADFYDTLDGEQQAELREHLTERMHHKRHRHD